MIRYATIPKFSELSSYSPAVVRTNILGAI